MCNFFNLLKVLFGFHFNTCLKLWKQEVNGDDVEDGDIEHRNYENYFIFSFQEQQLYTLLHTRNVDNVLGRDKLRQRLKQKI